MNFDINRSYTQGQVCKELNVARETFVKHYRNRRDFPKPIASSKTYKTWDGMALANYFHKKAV